MRVRVLLLDGNCIEGYLYKDSQLQNQLITRNAIGDYLNRMYNRVYFKSDSLTGSFSAISVDFWKVTEDIEQLGE